MREIFQTFTYRLCRREDKNEETKHSLTAYDLGELQLSGEGGGPLQYSTSKVTTYTSFAVTNILARI